MPWCARFCVALAAMCASAQSPQLTITPSATLHTMAQVRSVRGVARDTADNLYVADTDAHVIQKIDSSGKVTVIAGDGEQGFAGEGGPAIAAELSAPSGVAVAADGTLYIADTGNRRVRAVGVDGVIRTVAGGGLVVGDGGDAVSALLRKPVAVVVDAGGNLYIADAGDFRVRRVDAAGKISTFAGSGVQGSSGDGAAAVNAELDAPSSLAFSSSGELLIGDRRGGVVRTVATDGTIRTVVNSTAKEGLPGSIRPNGVAVAADGSVYVADGATHRLLRESDGVIGAEAGTGEQAIASDGVSPANASFDRPAAVMVSSTGNVVIAERSGRISDLVLPTLVFPPVTAGNSAIQEIQLANTGDVALSVSAVTLPAPFDLQPGNCGVLPVHIEPGKTCTAQVRFRASAAGSFSGEVTFAGTGFLSRSMYLSAQSIASPALIATTTTVQAAANAYLNQPLTVTANIFAAGTGNPTGSVRFFDAGVLLGNVALADGKAEWLIASPAVGTHTFTAAYSGDGVFAPSSSVNTISVVGETAPEFELSVNSPSSTSITVAANAPAVFTFQIAPTGGSYMQTVTFSAENVPQGISVAFDPVSVVPGSSAHTVLMTVKVVESASVRDSLLVLVGGLLPFFLLRKRRWMTLMMWIPVLGCAGHPTVSKPSSPSQKTAVLTVVATSSSTLSNTLVKKVSVNITIR